VRRFRNRAQRPDVLFNSLEFVVFFVLLYNVYLHLQHHHRAQNWLLLAGSYVFYGWWDWRFLSLLVLSTLIDFFVGRHLARIDAAHPELPYDDRRRKRWMLASVVSNLGMLGVFKYFDFFAESFAEAAARLGWQVDALTLELVLPVGISFYTFQTLSYTLDIYRRRLQASDDLLTFSVYVTFFPQLVAGPIERAQTFLPQVARPRVIDAGQIEAGIWLILWGLFKKVVIADNVAGVANAVFNGHATHDGLDLVIGALAFTVQIYGDFSGYTDIAAGSPSSWASS
jgi:alginate O-acetyltransferase complex protein AlgI